MQTKHFTTPLELKDDSDTGSVVARFSVFDNVDRDGDILRRSAFTDGQEVPMVWHHDWKTPVGKGRIKVADDHAQFQGSFFSTAAGQEARGTVREMGSLMQWSFGFKVTDTQDNDDIRGLDITGAEVFEVSPVLVGANPETATIAVKSDDATDSEEAKAPEITVDGVALAQWLEEHGYEPTAPHESPEDVGEDLQTIELERAALERLELEG